MSYDYEQLRRDFSERTGVKVGTILQSRGPRGPFWMVNEIYVCVGGGISLEGSRMTGRSCMSKTHLRTRLPRLKSLQIIGHRDRPEELPFPFRPGP